MSSHEPIDADTIREAIRRCPAVDSSSWVVGLSIVTRGGETIDGQAVYLADNDTAVISNPEGERSLAVVEIANVLSRLESPGPE